MKLSELILKAEQTFNELGDLDVVMLTDTPSNMFHIDFEPWADAIIAPDEKDIERSMFALGWHSLDDDNMLQEPVKPRLRIIKND